MTHRFLTVLCLLLPLVSMARNFEITEVQIHYDPVLTVKYLPTANQAIATLDPELVFEFVPIEDSTEHYVGRIEVTLYLHGTIDPLKTTYPRQTENALQIFEEQVVDAAILLRNKFGGELSRQSGAQFEHPETFMLEMLDAWNLYWEKSREMWEPYLLALRTERFPVFDKHYVRSFRYHYFGEAVPVSG